MFKKYHKSCMLFLRLFLLIIPIVLILGCDVIIPEEFKAKEYENQSEIDLRAVGILTKSTGVNINSKALAAIVDSATRANNTDNQIIRSKFSNVVDSLEQILGDSLNIIKFPGNQKITYAILSIGGQKNIYIYVSRNYNKSNLNDYLTIEVVKRDTSTVSYTDDMSPEIAYGSIQPLIDDPSQKVPTIRARYKYQLGSDVYIVRFILSNPQPSVDPFKIAVLSF